MTDIAKIAAGLSEAQKSVILQALFSDYLGVWVVRPSRRRAMFERLGLSRHVWLPDIGEYDRLTPLGLQVREYLERQNDG